MKPAARIELNGKDVTSKWATALVSLTVTDEAGTKSDTLEVVLSNAQTLSAPPIDAEVKVWLGYEPEPVYMGLYKIDEWRKEYPPSILTVTAKAAELTTKIKGAKTRSFHDTTVKAIVRKIAGEHKLMAVVDANIGNVVIGHIDQQTESDLGFLSRLAKRVGATFKLADGKVIFAAKGSRVAPSGNAKTPIAIKQGDLSSWSVTFNKRSDYSGVSCAFMDHAAGKRVYVLEGNTDGTVHRDKRLYGSRAEAKAAAKAQLGDLKRGQRSVELNGPGNPTLFAEAWAKLSDFDPDCDGEYFVKSVTHSFSGSGFTTSVSLEPDETSEDGAS